MSFRIVLSLALFFILPLRAAQATEDVPFIVTPDHVTLAMLRIASVTPQDTLIDLGSGDGRIVILAAKRFGARTLGVEIVPELVRKSRENARVAGVSHRAEFLEQDIFKTDLSSATVVTMYLLPAVNLQLRPALLQLKPGTRIVSHDWDMGEWRPDRTLAVAVPDKSVGREKLSRVFLWTVPARAAGAWCGRDQHSGVRLEIAQQFQDVEGKLLHQGREHVFKGSFMGAHLQARRDSDGRADFDMEDDVLVLKRGGGPFKPYRGARFERAVAGTC